jgi:hypothetical protein
MPLAAGAKLDCYVVIGPLGGGGMGEVYRARDSALKREVAIKVLPAFVSQDPDRLRRFEQEAEAAAALNHPNILTVYQLGTFEGAPYLVTEVLEGVTLRQQLEHGPLTVRKAIDCGVQIAHGLAAAHEKGIVHRDLKPENLFVCKDGRVKILDFGLAKLTQRQPETDGDGLDRMIETEPGVVMGTVGYMAPEQVRGKVVDHRADIFAFGAILYEMLAGTRAFKRSTSAETMTAILNDDPPGISQVAQSTPPGLQRVVHRCLEKNPGQRFQSASDLAFALEALSDSGFSSGKTEKRDDVRPRRALAWLAGGVVVAALAAFALFKLWPRQPEPFEHFSIQKAMDRENVLRTAVSADGAYLASVLIAANGDESLLVHHIPTGSERAILEDAAFGYDDIIFSPDGSYIYFRSHALDHTNREDVYRIPVLGGQPTRVIEDVDAPMAFINGGQQVCFYRQNSKDRIYKFLSASTDGSDEQVLATVKAPLSTSFPVSAACAPDGKRAVVSERYVPNVEVLDFGSGMRRPLTSNLRTDGWFLDLHWLPSGKGILAFEFTSPRYAGQVVLLSYPGGKLRQITNDLNDYQGISLTLDAKTIATMQRIPNDRFESFSLTDPSRPEERGPLGLRWFTWLDNERILASEQSGSLKVINLQKDETTTLNVAKNLSLSQPAPCGPERLVASGYRPGGIGHRIYIMRLDGSGATQITQGMDVLPSCTPDARWLFYVDLDHQFLFRQPLEGGVAQNIGT